MKGLKYFAEYSDFDGQEYKIEIWVEGFTGVATEVTAGGNPVTVDRNKDVSETYLGGIVPTFYRFEFVTDTNFSTRVFDSEKYGDVVIQHYKGTNLQFNAIVQPFVGMEQDLPDGLSVFTLSGECGLEYLKNKKFANPTDTNVRLIDLIQEAVDLIPYVEKFGFKVFDNTALYNGLTRINSNQNFLEARINRKTFTDYTYYDVLLNLVANRNEIYFDNGYWWVRNLSELSELYTTNNTGTLVTYDENGDFLTSIPNYRPSKSIIRQAGGSFGKLFSQKNVVVKRIEPERINYVLNGSFDQGSTNFVPNNWTAGSEAFSSVLGADFFRFVESVYTPTLTSDNAYIQSTAITWEPFGALFASPVREPQKLTFRANVEIGTGISACRFQIIATIGGSPFYLTSDLAWTTTPTVMQKKPDASGKIEFDVPQPPNQGFTNLNNFNVPIIYNVSMRLFRSERAFETTVGTATYFTQYNEVSFFKDSLYTQFFDEYIGKSDYRQDENSDRENPLELETIIASQNSFPYRHGSLFDAEGVAANGFGSVNSLSGTIYNIYLATSYLNVTSKRLTYYQGSSFEHFDFSDVLLIDGIHFRVSNYSHDIKSKTVQFKAIELTYSSGFVLDTNKIKSDVEKAITVVNNIGLIPQDYNFTSSTNFDGRTSFGMRPDVRHVSASLTEMFLRAEPSAADSVSIKPGVEGIELLTPPPLATTPETLATREWAANGLETKYLQLDTTYTNGNFPGRLSWDADHDLMFLGLENDYTAKIPQDSVWSCIAGEAITKGQLVYASGTVGNSGKIQASRFIANGTIPSRFVIGVATRTVAQGETFHALRAGVLRGLDTSSYTAGQDLWASSTVAGGFQTTAPTAPNPKMSVAFVVTSHANNGELAVRIVPSLSVSLLDDVQITSPATNQLLRYNNNRWENWTPNFLTGTAGTLNFIPKFGAGNTLINSVITELNGNIGIGTSISDGSKLRVNGTVSISQLDAGSSTDSIVTVSSSGFLNKVSYDSFVSSKTQFNWNDNTVINNVVGLLAWRYFGNSHVIFDASAGTSPSGTFINNVNPDSYWVANYPTLMGWNGGNTFGVRVDSARVADGLVSMNISQFTNNSGYISGSGTLNTIPKFGAGNTLVDSVITEVGGDVEIGKNLRVEGTIELGNGNDLAWAYGDGFYYNYITNRYNTTDGIVYRSGGWTGALSIIAHSFETWVNGSWSKQLVINQAGNVLIGTTISDGSKLQVNGDVRIASLLTVPAIGNSAGVSAQNTWTFASNINVPLSPSASTHATSKFYVDNLVATGIKEGDPVRSISLINISLSGTQNVSGVALVAGDRILVAGQTTASQNGVYIVASGAWSRASDSDTDAELRGYQYLITAGTYINAKYRNSNTDAIIVGITAITYVVSQGAEKDPIFLASPAATITQQFINNWNANYAIWGTNTPDSIFAARSTTNLVEGSRLYFTDARARAALSFAAGSGAYNSATGLITIPTQISHLTNNSDFARVPTLGTVNRLSKFTGDGRSLGDSVVSEVLGGIGINTTENLGLGAVGRGTIVVSGINDAILTLGVAGQFGAFLYTDVNSNTYLVTRSGFLVFQLAGFERLRITASGNILTDGRTDTGHKLQVNGDVRIATLNAGSDLDSIVTATAAGVLTKIPNILTNKQFTDVAAGLRQLRSIDYYESRMDFGFDKVLDVPYLYYDKNGTRYVNYMNGDGVFVHVDSSGIEREYLRVGDIAADVPNLQQVSEAGKSSSIRLQWNGTDYATLNDIVTASTPTLQAVSQQGSNSTIRLSFNGQNYATLADLQSLSLPTPSLSSVLAVGNNAFGTAIKFGDPQIIGIADSLYLLSRNDLNGIVVGENSVFIGNTTSSYLNVDRLFGTMLFTTQVSGFRWNNGTAINYAFHNVPSTLTAGAKYVFLWDGNKFIIVNA